MKNSEKTLNGGGVINKVKFIQAITKLVFATLVGVSLLLFSVNHVTANDTKKFNFPDKLTEADKLAIQNSNGRYQTSIASTTQGGKVYWYIVVCDTSTGRTKFYYGSVAHGTRAADSKFQLPSSPL